MWLLEAIEDSRGRTLERQTWRYEDQQDQQDQQDLECKNWKYEDKENLEAQEDRSRSRDSSPYHTARIRAVTLGSNFTARIF